VEAIVQGTEDYDVVIEFPEEGSRVGCSCTCPYFADRGPCKHLWATLLYVDAHNLLTAPNDMVGIGDLDDPDDTNFEGWEKEFEADDDLSGGEPPPRSTIQRQPTGWKAAMDEIRRAAAHPRSNDEHADTQYRYIIDMAETLHGRGTMLRVVQTRPKKSGGWTKLKPVKYGPKSTDGIADPEDHRCLALLKGGADTSRHYGYGIRTDGVYLLSATLTDLLLPDLASTGRLYLAADAYDLDEAMPLRLDDGEPWQFRLSVSKDEQQKRYVVSGLLVRGREGMELKEPQMLLAGGWVFYLDRLARLDDSGAFEWISVLRRETQLIVPANEADQWLMDFLACPRVPPIALPEELQVERVAVTPKPGLKLFVAARDTDGAYLGGVLQHDYDGVALPGASQLPGIFDAGKRRLIERDRVVENASAARLVELGFRKARPYYHAVYPEPCDFEIRAKQFVKAAAALVHDGWRIEAKGKLYRTAGTVTMSVSSGIDWFDLNGSVDFGGATASLPLLLKALKKGSQTIVLDDGSIGMLPSAWLKRYGALGAMGQVEVEGVRFSRSQASLLDALLAAEPQATFDDGFALMRDELSKFTSVKPVEAPKGFQGTLRDYQRDGLGWLRFLQRFGFGGCLADDMGLGKTVQVLALLESRRSGRTTNGAAEKRPSLVVVPRSLIFNWIQEAVRFTPRLKVLDHSGVGRDAGEGKFRGHDLVLTTYGTLRRDILLLRQIEFDYVILDEAQAIKNSATSTAKAARLLRARHRLAMSGTPIENHLSELWSLFEFLNPGMLGTASAFRLSLSGAQDNNEEHIRMLACALRPFVLRRTKAEVIKELPARLEETIHCDLLPAQRKQYDELRDHYRRALQGMVEEKGMAKSKIMVLEALLRLRQAACHPGLIDKSKTGQPSAKLDVVMGQIEDVVDEDHKILVFSQFTSLLAIVRKRLDGEGIPYAYLDGRTRNRQVVVERFQSDPLCKVFLISLKAGGLGLNLTAADYVVLLDPWWNPAVEAQAIDRTHRIGQTRRVFAYRIVARETVEERILELQQKKKRLADSIITADNGLIRSLTREDLELLLA